ncbi:choice-of-anchor Q domain-containing protein [Pseudomonadota bacterium]
MTLTNATPRYQPATFTRKALCFVLAHGILGLPMAHAAIIDVDSLSDTTAPSACTLRDAIESANTDAAVGGCAAGSLVDTITFDGLTTPATIQLTNGQLTIKTPMNIQGPGQDQLTIDAGGLSRVISIDSWAPDTPDTDIDVSIDGVTVSGGLIPNASIPFEGYNGAGIESLENLTLSNVTISGNTATTDGAAGGLYIFRGIATITDSTITNNSSYWAGAGIDVGKATLNITDSFVTNNHTQNGDGAGINVWGGTLNLLRSTVSGNTAEGDFKGGGGIYARGLPFGATARRADISIINSQISQNTAPGGGALKVSEFATVSISNSTLTANTANGTGNFDAGGAIDANSNGKSGDEGYTITIVNTTISGNSATRGGAINTTGGILTINHVTMTDNSASEGTFGAVGGLVVGSGSNIDMSNSIIANSTGADCEDKFAALASNINNLIEDGTCATDAVNLVTGDPLLGPLQDNGGLTPTHALLTGSPAIDAGDSTECAAKDQRGIDRNSASCDIGAFEIEEAGDDIFMDGFETTL